MDRGKIQLIETDDGSLSIADPQTGELQHNRAGAYTEAMENYYIPSGVCQRLREHKELTVLDACYGLGYNSLVTMAELAKAGAAGHVNIIAVERDAQVLQLAPFILQDRRLAQVQSALSAPSQAGICTARLGDLN